jgi:hypothetical protein
MVAAARRAFSVINNYLNVFVGQGKTKNEE